MNSYLVERYLPGTSEAELRTGLRRVHVACAELSAAGTSVRYLGSMFLPLEEACFCRFEGAVADAVAQANELAGVPFARINAGVAVTPDEVISHQPDTGRR